MKYKVKVDKRCAVLVVEMPDKSSTYIAEFRDEAEAECICRLLNAGSEVADDAERSLFNDPRGTAANALLKSLGKYKALVGIMSALAETES